MTRVKTGFHFVETKRILMLALSTRLRESNESVMSLASLGVTRRIARRLLSLSIRQSEPLPDDSIRIGADETWW